MGDKSQDSSFKKGAPRTYTFRFCQNKISILYKKKMVWIKNFQNVLVLGDSDKIIEVISKQENFLLLVY